MGVSNTVRIAILDWDGTLRQGWTLPDWVEFLVRTQVLDQAATVRIAAPFDHYAAGIIDHDRLAIEATGVFAREMNGISVKATRELIPRFIQEDRRRLFPFFAQIMALLTEHNIEPIILSGAPVEILREHMESIAANNIIGLQLRQIDGRYLGEIAHNPASKQAKMHWVSKLTRRGSQVVLGMGNSTADVPVLSASQIAIVVGDGLSDFVHEHEIRLNGTGGQRQQLDQLNRLVAEVGHPWPGRLNGAHSRSVER